VQWALPRSTSATRHEVSANERRDALVREQSLRFNESRGDYFAAVDPELRLGMQM
jgi:hypothetical protein